MAGGGAGEAVCGGPLVWREASLMRMGVVGGGDADSGGHRGQREEAPGRSRRGRRTRSPVATEAPTGAPHGGRPPLALPGSCGGDK